MNYFQLVQYFTGYYIGLQKEKKFIQRELTPLVDACCTQLNYTLSKPDRKKVLTYYPCFTVLAGGENFLLLKNRKINEQERWRLSIVSAMSSLCDDLIDEEGWTTSQLFELLELNIANLPLSSKAKIILFLNEELYKRQRPSSLYEHQLRTAIEWQAASLKQTSTDISTEEIMKISREKNGNTSLMFAYLLDEEWNDTEKQIIHQSGYLGQLVNDAYDIFKDIRDGVQTYIQRIPSVSEAETLFLTEWKNLIRLIQSSDASIDNQLHLIRRFACIHGYALVAFEQFRKIEAKGNLPVQWQQASRKELVIDMELWSTRFKLLKEIIRLTRIQP